VPRRTLGLSNTSAIYLLFKYLSDFKFEWFAFIVLAQCAGTLIATLRHRSQRAFGSNLVLLLFAVNLALSNKEIMD